MVISMKTQKVFLWKWSGTRTGMKLSERTANEQRNNFERLSESVLCLGFFFFCFMLELEISIHVSGCFFHPLTRWIQSFIHADHAKQKVCFVVAFLIFLCLILSSPFTYSTQKITRNRLFYTSSLLNDQGFILSIYWFFLF